MDETPQTPGTAPAGGHPGAAGEAGTPMGPDTERHAEPGAPDEPGTDTGITSPPDATRDATTPPGNGDLDEDAAAAGRDRLEQAGGGH